MNKRVRKVHVQSIGRDQTRVTGVYSLTEAQRLLVVASDLIKWSDVKITILLGVVVELP